MIIIIVIHITVIGVYITISVIPKEITIRLASNRKLSPNRINRQKNVSVGACHIFGFYMILMRYFDIFFRIFLFFQSHSVSFIFIQFPSFSFSFLHFHSVSFIFIQFPSFSFSFLYFHSVSFIFVQFHSFSFIFIHFRSFYFIFIR
jgi:hypothetical protein